jgi:hypothetical protein
MRPLFMDDLATEQMKERIRRAESFRVRAEARAGRGSWLRRLGRRS